MIKVTDPNSRRSVMVFGATGTIGNAICEWFASHGSDVVAVSRSNPLPNPLPAIRWLVWDDDRNQSLFAGIQKQSIDAVVWAQGVNFNDSIRTFNLSKHQRMYDANVSYVLLSLQALLNQDLLAPNARLCVISSIWQNLARQNKLSYCITKSALQGLVRSLSVDLGQLGYLINTVLPGALDTPMTRSNLSETQILRLEEMTPLGSLPVLDDVCELVGFLCSTANTGITGQFISADRGFSHARII